MAVEKAALRAKKLPPPPGNANCTERSVQAVEIAGGPQSVYSRFGNRWIPGPLSSLGVPGTGMDICTERSAEVVEIAGGPQSVYSRFGNRWSLGPLSSLGVPGTGMEVSFRKIRRFFASCPRSSTPSARPASHQEIPKKETSPRKIRTKSGPGQEPKPQPRPNSASLTPPLFYTISSRLMLLLHSGILITVAISGPA